MRNLLVALFLCLSFISCDNDSQIILDPEPEEETIFTEEQVALIGENITGAHNVVSFTTHITKLIFGTVIKYPNLHGDVNINGEEIISIRSNDCPSISPDPNTIDEIPAEGIDFIFSTHQDCFVGDAAIPCLGDIAVNLKGDICSTEGSIIEICPLENFKYFVPESELNPYTTPGYLTVDGGCMTFTFIGKNENDELCYDADVTEDFIIYDEAIFKNDLVICGMEGGKLNVANATNNDLTNLVTLLDDLMTLTYEDLIVGKIKDGEKRCPAGEIDFQPGSIEFNAFCSCPTGGFVNFNFWDLPINVDFDQNQACAGGENVDVVINSLPFPTGDIIFCQ